MDHSEFDSRAASIETRPTKCKMTRVCFFILAAAICQAHPTPEPDYEKYFEPALASRGLSNYDDLLTHFSKIVDTFPQHQRHLIRFRFVDEQDSVSGRSTGNSCPPPLVSNSTEVPPTTSTEAQNVTKSPVTRFASLDYTTKRGFRSRSSVRPLNTELSSLLRRTEANPLLGHSLSDNFLYNRVVNRDAPRLFVITVVKVFVKHVEKDVEVEKDSSVQCPVYQV